MEHRDRREAGETLQFRKHTFTANFAYSTKPTGKGAKNANEVKQGKASAKVQIAIPYLTNMVHVARGKELVASQKVLVTQPWW